MKQPKNSNKNSVTPTVSSSRKSKKNKLCRSIYALKKSKNSPIIVEFTARDLIPFLASIDPNYTNYVTTGKSSEYRNYWNKNLKQSFLRAMDKKGCIRKVSDSDNMSLDTPLRHYPDQVDGNLCAEFMQKIAQNSQQQSTGGMGSKIVTLSNYEVHDATIKMLRNVTELANVTSGSTKYRKILADSLFKDEKELCVHGLHYVIRGQIYNREFNDDRSPYPVTYNGVEYSWKKMKGGWSLSYDYDYSNTGDLVRVQFTVAGGVIQVHMGESQPGYCLDNNQLDNYYNYTIGVINHSLLMEVPHELVEDVAYDINQDIPVELIYAYDPDLIEYLRYITPSGEINFPRYDFKNEAMKGSYFQIYLKKKMVNGELKDYFRFEISLRSKSAVETMKREPVRKFVSKTLYGIPGEHGGIITIHEDTKKAGGESIRDAFDDGSPAPYMNMIDEFIEMRASVEDKLDTMAAKHENQISNITHTTVVNSMIVNKLAQDISKFSGEIKQFQEYDLGGLVAQQQLVVQQVEDILADPLLLGEQLQSLVISNQETLQQFMGGQMETNSLLTDNLTTLQEDYLDVKEIVDRQVRTEEKTSEILSEIKNSMVRREGDQVNFTTQYIVKHEGVLSSEHLAAVKEVEFVTHKKKLIDKRVVNANILQEIIDLFAQDKQWRSLVQIRKELGRKELYIRNAVYLGMDSAILHSRKGIPRANSVQYNLR